MNKTCRGHQCFKKDACPKKIWLARLALCRILHPRKLPLCSYRAPLPYGRYELEDVLLP